MFLSYVVGTFWYYIDLWVPLFNDVSRHLVSHCDIKMAIIKYIIKKKYFFGFIPAVLFLCFFLCLRICWQTLWVGSGRYSGRRSTGKCIVDITLLILSPLFVFQFSRISRTKFLFFVIYIYKRYQASLNKIQAIYLTVNDIFTMTNIRQNEATKLLVWRKILLTIFVDIMLVVVGRGGQYCRVRGGGGR